MAPAETGNEVQHRIRFFAVRFPIRRKHYGRAKFDVSMVESAEHRAWYLNELDTIGFFEGTGRYFLVECQFYGTRILGFENESSGFAIQIARAMTWNGVIQTSSGDGLNSVACSGEFGKRFREGVRGWVNQDRRCRIDILHILREYSRRMKPIAEFIARFFSGAFADDYIDTTGEGSSLYSRCEEQSKVEESR